MLFLIDGYNVTMRPGTGFRGSKEAQRDALVRELIVHGRRLLGAGDIVCVFDARESFGRSTERVGPVGIAFATDADAEIVRRAALARGQVTVVTDDMRLRARIAQDVGRHIRFRDTTVVSEGRPSVDSKGRGRDRGRGAGSGRDAREDGRVTRRQADQITAELAREWLDDGEL